MTSPPAGRVLVLNCGSSSVKYRLYDHDTIVDGGLIERIGEDGRGASIAARNERGAQRSGTSGACEASTGLSGPRDHEEALHDLMERLDLGELAAVGHRVVHGGLRFSAPTLIDDDVVAAVQGLVPLAPLHNPANLTGIAVARMLLPDTPQVAVFDTAFHRTLRPDAGTYAIDRQVTQEHGIHRYGFHGTSHAYVSRRTAALLGRAYEDVNVITLHLGNGASACAVAGGRSVATSMGLSPLEGLVMGTRSGDIDPAIIFHLWRNGGMSVDEIDHLLNQRSGLLGLCGANDMREVLRRRASGDATAALAFDIYCRRITSYVGAYYALLGRVDAITFTAGIGENASPVRAAALANLERLGIAVSPDRNETGAGERIISADGAEVAVCVVPTDEEREIATQALLVAQTIE